MRIGLAWASEVFKYQNFESQILALFDISSLNQFSKFNNFLWVCWFLSKNLSNFVRLVWKSHNRYCHNMEHAGFDLKSSLIHFSNHKLPSFISKVLHKSKLKQQRIHLSLFFLTLSYPVHWTYTPCQIVWSGSKSVVTIGLTKILTHPC